MILVGTMAATLWIIGAGMGAPRQARWTMIGLLIVAVLALHVILPDGHPLRAATGGEPAFWLLLIALAGLVLAYRRLLGRVRAKAVAREAALAPPPPPPSPPGQFAEGELERYARHIVLHQIGGPGQMRLKTARVLVVGAGGLGAPALQYLAAAGIGTIGVIDGDVVEETNLQRQVIHSEETVGMPKVFSAAQAIARLNRHVAVRPYHRRLTGEIAAELFAEYDLILDGSDNFETRYAVNAAAVATGRPLIAAAMTQWEGQISLYHPASGAPCYACIFPEPPEAGLVPSCAEAGVAGPLPGVIGSMMALEAVKHVTGAGEGLAGRLMILDGLWAETRTIRLARRADCAVCGTERGDGLRAPGAAAYSDEKQQGD